MSVEISPANREEKIRALESVIKSRTFARSDQLQGFLRYICELELDGRGNTITEYSIATGALNRPSDYAPGEDSSVRSRAHALRRKLVEFYEEEVPDAEWRIQLPKGSYRPLFVRAADEPVQPPASVAPPTPAEKRFTPVGGFLIGIATATIVATIVFAILVVRWRTPAIDAAIREAWGPALAAPSDALVVIACPPIARMAPSYPGLVPRANNSFLAPADLSDWYAGLHLENRGGPLFMFRSRGYTVLADTLAAIRTGNLLHAAGTNFQVVPEPTVLPMGIHERALILIGSPAFAPFIARLLKITPFTIRFDPTKNDEVISEGPPESARTIFAAKRDPGTNRFSTVYGLITVLPSQPGRERPERTLIFSGISGSPGAEAAVQFFSSPAAMRDLQERFRRQGLSQFPPAYQVVVRCGVDAEAAMNSIYETHRVMTNPPVLE